MQLYDVNQAPLRKVEVHDFGTPTYYRSRSRYHSYTDDGPQMTSLRLKRSIAGRMCSWTITDANLSPDNRWLIYSSLTPYVHLVPTSDIAEDSAGTGTGARGNPAVDEQVTLDMCGLRGRDSFYGDGLFSVRFSGNSKEIVAGARNGGIYVYDVEARKNVLAVTAHNDDVNSVCFADVGSSNMLLSGSDDAW